MSLSKWGYVDIGTYILQRLHFYTAFYYGDRDNQPLRRWAPSCFYGTELANLLLNVDRSRA